MTHMIENNMIAWKNGKPWHELGTEATPEVFESTRQMLKAQGQPSTDTDVWLALAKMRWTVQRRAIAMRPGNGDKSIMLTSQLEGFRAIVRSDTDHVFQVASERYKPVQNAEIVDFFRQYCEAGHAQMETVGALKDGAVVWALAKLNGGTTATLPGGDELRGYMLLATSHDGSLQTIGKPTQTRVVCWNTLSAALGTRGKNGHLGKREAQEFRVRHVSKFDSSARANAQKVMGMAIEQVSSLNETADALAQVHIDADDRLEFVERVLTAGGYLDAIVQDQQPAPSTGSLLDSIVGNTQRMSRDARVERMGKVGRAILQGILNSPGCNLESAKDTLWGAVNGVTFYTDHEAPARSHSNRLASAWFGQNQGLKQTALQVALEMAGKQAVAA